MADDLAVLDGAGASQTLKAKEISSKKYPGKILYDEAGAEVVGLVTASPGSTTLLGRLKSVADSVAASRIQKWVAGAGAGLTWTSAFSTEINSVVSGNAILSSVDITNGTALDMYADVSFDAGGTITSAAPNYLGLYLYPLNQDATTYGDGRFGTSAAGPPPGNYAVGGFGFAAAASTTIHGMVRRIIIPPGTFRFLIHNQAGATLASSNTVKYRTYNLGAA